MSSGHSTGDLSYLLLSLALIFLFSRVLNSILGRFKLPSVVGDLAAGLTFAFLYAYLPEGAPLYSEIHYMKGSEVITMLGELGVIILLLEVGLETEVKKILSSGREATLVALGGVLAPFLFAYGLDIGIQLSNSYLGTDFAVFPTAEVLFIGLVFAATSIGVTAGVFQELKMLASYNAQIILAAAVIDDVLGLILLSVVVGLVQSGQFALSAVALIVIKSILFLALAFWINPRLSAKTFPILNRIGKRQPLVFLIWILILCFFFAYMAQFMGLAAIIGAFALGATLDSISVRNVFGESKRVEDYIAPIRAFLVPIFFVNVGLSVDPTQLFSWLALILTVLACISKLVSGWILVPYRTHMNRLLVGVGMMPRGEVGLVVAQIGYQTHVLTGELYSALLVSIIATTVIAPVWLQMILSRQNLTESEGSK